MRLFVLLVHVQQHDIVDGFVQFVGYGLDDSITNDQALGSTETSERCVGDSVRLADTPTNVYVREIVDVIQMSHCTL